MTSQANRPYRVVVLGAARVGKSSIISRFLYDKYHDSYEATVEECHRRRLESRSVAVELQIVDTAGAYQFPGMKRLAISTANAFVLVFSVDDSQSFAEVRRVREDILGMRADGDAAPPIVVVGNKVDLAQEGRAVGRAEAEMTANLDWNNGYVEASAKDDVNVAAIFDELLLRARLPPAPPPKPVLKRHLTAPDLDSGKKLNRILMKRNSCTIS